jgi:hypothetical protein
MRKGALRMEDRYDTDIDDLWSALTDPLRPWRRSVDSARAKLANHARLRPLHVGTAVRFSGLVT